MLQCAYTAEVYPLSLCGTALVRSHRTRRIHGLHTGWRVRVRLVHANRRCACDPEQLGAEIVGGRAVTHFSLSARPRHQSRQVCATIQRAALSTLTAAHPEFPSVLGSRCGGLLRF
jgi:hypothetical protein